MEQVNRMMNEKASYRQEERAAIRREEEAAARELERLEKKKNQAAGGKSLKGMVKRHTFKLGAISTFRQIHEKYKAHYDEMAARILDSNEVPIFMDKNEKIKNQGKSKSFDDNVRGRFSRASRAIER